ncbi:MAG: sulfite reductase flavoprotein subunit alpha [Candidatus Methylacidiphilales bacterium]
MSETVSAAPTLYTKNNPYHARITSRELLNKSGSAKETLHFVVNIAGSGLTYEPGQSIGIFPLNPPELVSDLVALNGWDVAAPIAQKDGSSLSFGEMLRSQLTLNRATAKFLKALLEKLTPGTEQSALEALVADKEALEAYLFTRDYVDIMKEYSGARFTEQEFAAIPARIVPRLYSIASSIAKHPDEVHLTVAIVRYETHGRKKKGLTTGFLADDAPLGEASLPVFFAPSKHFKLPEDPSTPVIMVGPGTGIAPFRAFLEQREIDHAPGKNWLFFGDQHEATDFLYEDEFKAWQHSGLLTRLDTAFSRDQEKKIYVQDRMKENGAEIWKWLHEERAYFYVCGDAQRMAKDVHQALIDIAIQHGDMTPEDADTHINKTLMREERRYLRDVY